MNKDQEEILEYCYTKAISDLVYSIQLNELIKIEPFNQKNIRIIIRELRNLENDGLIELSGNSPVENLEYVFVGITLNGLIFWEEKKLDISPVFTELTKKFLKFVQEVELGKRKLNEGEGSQYGNITLPQLSEILNEPFEDRIIFIQQKSDSIFTQKIGYASHTGIIFYGKNEPFLTIEGADFLVNQNDFRNKEADSESHNLVLQRVNNETIKCKFPGDDNFTTLKHIANFNSILPDFYAVAGMQLDNDKQSWYTKELYGNQISVIAESTGLYIEENKEIYAEVQKLKKTLVIKKEIEKAYGKWEIIRMINNGGQGFIYEVKLEGGETHYALKSYRKTGNTTYQKQKIKRFQSEVDALKITIDCHHVIRLIDEGGIKQIDVFTDYYFVMELADMDLDRYVKQSTKFDLNKISKYYRQLIEAFNCIHKKGIIHRDIKPQNILIRDDNIKISDFGINYGTADNRITLTREVVGPRFFICPESEDGRLTNPDIRCDIYSLGKILYYLLSKGKYFTREKFEEEEFNLIKIHNDPRFEVFNSFFRNTIAFEKEKRFGSVEELRIGFENCLKEFDNFINNKINREINIILECLEQWRIKPLKENDASYHILYELINKNYYRKVNLVNKELCVLKKVIKSIHYQMTVHNVILNPDLVSILYLMIKTPFLLNIIREKFKAILEVEYKKNKENQSLIKILFEIGSFGSWLDAFKLSVREFNLVMFGFLENEFFEQIRTKNIIENKRSVISELSSLRDEVEKLNQNKSTNDIIKKIETLRRHLLSLN